MGIAVERDMCVGSEQCVYLAPEVFELSDDDGLVVLRTNGDTPEHELASNVREAVHQCPSGALTFASEAGEPR
jgi:ferredoxin